MFTKIIINPNYFWYSYDRNTYYKKYYRFDNDETFLNLRDQMLCGMC